MMLRLRYKRGRQSQSGAVTRGNIYIRRQGGRELVQSERDVETLGRGEVDRSISGVLGLRSETRVRDGECDWAGGVVV